MKILKLVEQILGVVQESGMETEEQLAALEAARVIASSQAEVVTFPQGQSDEQMA